MWSFWQSKSEDSYKVSHWKQYPPGTEYVYSSLQQNFPMYGKPLKIGVPAIDDGWSSTEPIQTPKLL